ncbi:MAG: 5'-deoxynucleotidase [Acutalibacteraceae bacterium]|nr:5'-deoxynucleotidase [Acutalibacteraceae bacterium]
MSNSHFFALVSRMKYINRWALMRNTESENLYEHSFEVAVIAHALCVIGNERFSRKYDADRAAVIALYHDFSEILTGDMPTPVKYRNESLKSEYKKVEREAAQSLIGQLPEDLQGEYGEIMLCDDESLTKIVKAADKLSALIKCSDELKMGNSEFSSAYDSTLKAIKDMHLQEADVFINEFMPSYSLPIDKLY